MNPPRIGLAISGGGFRAACFGLGCLRALHDKYLLPHVSVISAISGGSVLAALYAYGPEEFGAFDASALDMLRGGLQWEIIRRALRPDRVGANLYHSAKAALGGGLHRSVLRGATRTDGLRDALTSGWFGHKTVEQVTHSGLATVITATDLITSNAVRFGSGQSSCSAYGIIQERVEVAEAVAASAAYPLLLPTIERQYTFQGSDRSMPVARSVLLTDGGVYDNLGLTALEQERSARHTAHVYDLDYVVSCDAGRGALSPAFGHFLGFRLRRSFDVTHRRVQDAARRSLHQSKASGTLRGFVQAYLGMPDDQLPMPVADLVPAAAVRKYPTDFAAMSDVAIEMLSIRGEQLTRTLLAYYCPEL